MLITRYTSNGTYSLIETFIFFFRVFSSVGRASRLHRECQRFKSVNTHNGKVA